jgi:hypothetical protein
MRRSRFVPRSEEVRFLPFAGRAFHLSLLHLLTLPSFRRSRHLSLRILSSHPLFSSPLLPVSFRTYPSFPSFSITTTTNNNNQQSLPAVVQQTPLFAFLSSSFDFVIFFSPFFRRRFLSSVLSSCFELSALSQSMSVFELRPFLERREKRRGRGGAKEKGWKSGKVLNSNVRRALGVSKHCQPTTTVSEGREDEHRAPESRHAMRKRGRMWEGLALRGSAEY